MHDQGASATAGPDDAGAWPTRIVDMVDGVVSLARDRVIRPLVIVARAIVFGILVATMALVVSILLSVAVVRLLDVYAFRNRVWASDAVVGGLFTAVGIVAWSKRHAGRDAETH